MCVRECVRAYGSVRVCVWGGGWGGGRRGRWAQRETETEKERR